MPDFSLSSIAISLWKGLKNERKGRSFQNVENTVPVIYFPELSYYSVNRSEQAEILFDEPFRAPLIYQHKLVEAAFL